jgi:hypothetical protein
MVQALRAPRSRIQASPFHLASAILTSNQRETLVAGGVEECRWLAWKQMAGAPVKRFGYRAILPVRLQSRTITAHHHHGSPSSDEQPSNTADKQGNYKIALD